VPHSKALEVNLQTSRVDVVLDPKYAPLQEITANYLGLLEGVNAFLKEVCHPYKNWQFIISEARKIALNNYQLFRTHPKGPDGVKLFVDIFFDAVADSGSQKIQAEALDNLLVYFQQIITESDSNLNRFQEVLDYGFGRMTALPEDTFILVVRSFYSLKNLAEALLKAASPESDFKAITTLFSRYLNHTYTYWCNEADPADWFEAEVRPQDASKLPIELFEPTSHDQFNKFKQELTEVTRNQSDGSADVLERLTDLPGFREIVTHYDQLPQELARAAESTAQGKWWMLIFLFHIMNLSGLSTIHERSLREINRTLNWLIDREELGRIQSLIATTFRILKHSADKFPRTALNSVDSMGKTVYRTNDSDLIEFFNAYVADLGFQNPNLQGMGDNWQVRSNASHILNIRVWLKLIERNPRWSKELLSSLIIHLALYGVFIKDTDLFPRDITSLLNSDIRPVYNPIKQLCRLFPTYFNEIGAEGALRDISTLIDDVIHRRDPLVHFLRKQSHVESSPQTVVLMEAVFDFWRTKNKRPLKDLVPQSIHDLIAVEGPNINGLHLLMKALFRTEEVNKVQDLLTLSEDRLTELIAPSRKGVTKEDRRRLQMAHSLYRMLYHKYHIDWLAIDNYLEQFQGGSFPNLDGLKSTLGQSDSRKKIMGLLDYLGQLKELILSEKVFEAQEDIYHKRHIAVDIPSMYGCYREAKFDALGLTLRLETLVNTLFQELIDNLDLKLITRATIFQIHDYLGLFDQALKLDGINSKEMERQIDLLSHALEVPGFSLTQYLDIFRGFSQVLSNIVNDYFNNIHHNQIVQILAQTPVNQLLPKYLPVGDDIDPKKITHRVIEIFLRDRIATSLSIQQLDQFISRILNTLSHQEHQIPKDIMPRLLDYDPYRALTSLYPVKSKISDIIHLGAKGFNLVRIIALGLPVPMGFIITTEVYHCREVIEEYPPAKEQFRNLVNDHIKQMERSTGKKFGDPKNPLLFSVRSGSSISQPGMMNTFLNVGINEEIVEGMAAQTGGRRWFAWDCYRRFLQSYGMAQGCKRDDFDAIMAERKQKYSLQYKRDFTGVQMKETALAYKDFISSRGIEIEQRPIEQLYLAVKGVFDSWNSPRARTYRKIMGISNDWGTAVTVQSMIFGNLSQEAGSGVFFTHNPRWSEDKLMLWGDFAVGNQGEDVVSGLVETLPINKRQAEIENRSTAVTLETKFPQIYRQIYASAEALIHTYGYSPQELEFTFEGPGKTDLFFLQNRDMVLRERPQTPGLDLSGVSPDRFIGRGIGVSGGGMSGRIVFNLNEIERWRRKEPATPLILLRGDTVPDDIREIFEADGLLTARGGSTSHAAIVAHQLNKTCIVGFDEMICNEYAKTCTIGQEVLKSGDWICIDGLAGSVYKGHVANNNIKKQEKGGK